MRPLKSPRRHTGWRQRLRDTAQRDWHHAMHRPYARYSRGLDRGRARANRGPCSVVLGCSGVHARQAGAVVQYSRAWGLRAAPTRSLAVTKRRASGPTQGPAPALASFGILSSSTHGHKHITAGIMSTQHTRAAGPCTPRHAARRVARARVSGARAAVAGSRGAGASYLARRSFVAPAAARLASSIFRPVERSGSHLTACRRSWR
jgi:hypothetical protein